MKAVLMLSRKLTPNSMIYFEKYKELFAENGIEFVQAYGDTEEEIIEGAGDAQIMLDMLQPITAHIIESLPCLKALIRSGIGVNNIDIEAASRRGILVLNSPDHCVEEVASLAMAHILNGVKQISRYDSCVKKGEWTILPPPRRLSSMAIGLIGFGNIARRVAGYAKGFGCRILAYDPYLEDAVFEANGAKRCTLEELYQEADAISIHVPLLPDTHHLLNREAFAKMKDGVIVVNTARGALIEEEALVEAVRNGKVGAAGLDVFETEPVPADHPFAVLPQITCTPHVGYRGIEAFEELEYKMAMTVVKLAKGEELRNVVNRRQLAQG